jgi:hypothetical protein
MVEAAAICVWLFLMWLGLTAIEHHVDTLLGFYVFAGATAASGLLGWLWKQ